MSDETCTLLYDEIVTETDDAVLFRVGDDDYWIPKSLLEDFEESKQDDTVGIPRWKAEELELEDFIE